ncbi:MAG: hypothetical protein RLZZ453_993 [Chlamydiota bacterium]|jgi:putative glutamate/gamma-aminobutyrate antiporter
MRKGISLFTVAMINVAAIMSLKNLPVQSEYGLSFIFYLLIACIGFFIPTALVSAELSTGWPKTGGVYVWVKEGLGEKWGFMAIWLQWIENVIWYPTMLAFTAGTLAYIISPDLAHNKAFTLSVILISFWGLTFLNFLGMKASGWISSFGVIAGTILPGALIIALGIGWVMGGNPLELQFTFENLIPDFSHLNSSVLLVGILLGLAGMELSAVHAGDVVNPQRDYPRAMVISVIIIIILSLLGSLAIGIVVPVSQLSLVAGVMEAFAIFFQAYHLEWITPIMAALIVVGALSMISTWIIGPSKGLMVTAHQGDLPPFFQKVNKEKMPIVLLYFQAVLVTVLSLVFLFMPTVSSSYWILTALTAQLYLVMYLLMFIAAIVLRYKKPNVQRAYQIPGGKKWGMWIVAGIGILSSLFSIGIGFIPPPQLSIGSLLFYELFLGLGMVLMCAFPWVVELFKTKKWIR